MEPVISSYKDRTVETTVAFWWPSYLKAEICAIHYSIAMCTDLFSVDICWLLNCNTMVPWAVFFRGDKQLYSSKTT